MSDAPKPPSSDEELMSAYQLGDSDAFDELYRRNSKRVYGYLKKRLSRREESDEVFQLVFTKLHASRNDFSRKYLFAQWLFVIVRTVLIDHFRKKGRTIDQPMDQPLEETREYKSAVSQSTPQEAYSSLEVDASRDIEVLSSLDVTQRQVVEWRVFDELSYQEIANRLSRSEQNIRQIFSRSLKKLKLSLSTPGDGK